MGSRVKKDRRAKRAAEKEKFLRMMSMSDEESLKHLQDNLPAEVLLPWGQGYPGKQPTFMSHHWRTRFFYQIQENLTLLGDPSKKYHHLVPAEYLRGFSKDDRVSQYDFKRGRPYPPANVTKVSGITHFYQSELTQGKSNFAEDWLANIESKGMRAIRKFVDGGPSALQPWDRMAMAAWVSAAYFRSWEERQSALETYDGTVKIQAALMPPEDVRPLAELQMDRNLTLDEVSEVQAQWRRGIMGRPIIKPEGGVAAMHIQTMLEATPGGASTMYDHPWTLVRTQESLVTSDAPVMVFGGKVDYGSSIYGFNRVMVPLDRNALLVVTRTDLPDGSFADEFDVHQFNRLIVRNASDWLYHHPDDDVSSLLDAYVPDKRVTEFRVLGSGNGLIASMSRRHMTSRFGYERRSTRQEQSGQD